jgi:hypothetical protein
MMSDKLQELILERMGFEDVVEPEKCSEVPILTRILQCEPESVELALGKFGQKFRAFAEAVDLSHPHVQTLFEDMFADDSDFCQDVTELLVLADYARKHGLTRVLSNIGGKVVTREKLCRAIVKTIDSPFNNRCRIRLLRTRQERDRVRAEKRMQAIDLGTVVKKGEEVWASQPDSFDNFIRFSTAYQEEIALAEKKALRYEKLGCSGLGKQIRDSIELFKTQVHEVYYGFNRITMTNAAVILAKSLKFRLVTTWPGDKKHYKIFVPSSFFEGYDFEVDPSFVPYTTSTGEPVRLRRAGESFDYEPRVYPLHRMWSAVPPSVVKIIDHLEAFPAACGKAIFDSYAVVVPGVAYPREGGDNSIISPVGQILNFNSREEATQALDLALIQKNYITPVLLGEKDGKCFFISFWR